MGESKSWLAKQSTGVQIVLLALPLLCLTAVVILLSVLLSEEIAKNSNSLTDRESTTPSIKHMEPCKTEACVAVAGSILSSMDPRVDPCVDFYQYTCGGFEREQNIPSGYSSYSSFSKARNLAQKSLREILEKDAPQNEGVARSKARQYYNSCLNTERIANNGKPALAELVEKLGGMFLKSTSLLPSDWSLETLQSKKHEYSVAGLFTYDVAEDLKNVTVNIIQIGQGGLGLGSGSRDYYLGKVVTEDKILVAYVDMLTTFAKLIVGEDAVERGLVEEVVKFEQKIAEVSIPYSELRDPFQMYSKQTINWLNQYAPFMKWTEFFAELFDRVDPKILIDATEPVLVYGSQYFRDFTKVMESYLSSPAGKRTIHNYIVLHAVMDYAENFGGEFQAASDKFYSVLTGKQGSLPLWQICVASTDAALGFGLGAMYVDEYFTAEARETAVFVIDRVSKAFRQRMIDLDWMDDETKIEALAKIEALSYEAAYPDWVKNDTYLKEYYRRLDVTSDFVQNQFKVYTFKFLESYGRLRIGPNPDIWYMTPQTVNAYYQPTQNKFVVPAGILSAPFFYQASEIPPAINFAAIGTVIGHEIGHGFDDSGSQFDGEGNLRLWWTANTLKEFNKRAQCLVDQYAAFEAEGLHLDGKQTLGENIGDNGGLRASFQAYKDYIKPYEQTTLIGLNLTADQLFFVGYSQVWCSLYTREAMISQILTNEHSPGPFRVNGPVSNSPDFAKAFSCPRNSPMNPDVKCTVW